MSDQIPNNPSQQPLDSEADASWLDKLAHDPGSETPETLTESLAMQQAILKFHQQEDRSLLEAASLLDDDHAWQRMQFRLKREGLLSRRPAWQLWLPAAAAAMVLAAVIVPNLLHEPAADDVLVSYSEPMDMRDLSPEQAVTEPLKAAQSLASQIKAFDPKVQLFWFEEVATIDFDAQPEQVPEISALIQKSFPNAKVQAGFNRLVFTQSK